MWVSWRRATARERDAAGVQGRAFPHRSQWRSRCSRPRAAAGKVRQRRFTEDRHRVEVLSDTQRIITPTVGDTAGHSVWYICHTPYEEGEIACDDASGTVPWLFHRNTSPRAFLLGPPDGGGDPNIGVAYGTCTKF